MKHVNDVLLNLDKVIVRHGILNYIIVLINVLHQKFLLKQKNKTEIKRNKRNNKRRNIATHIILSQVKKIFFPPLFDYQIYLYCAICS